MVSVLYNMTFDGVTSLEELQRLITTGFPTRASWEEMEMRDYLHFMTSIQTRFGNDGIHIVETNQVLLGIRRLP